MKGPILSYIFQQHVHKSSVQILPLSIAIASLINQVNFSQKHLLAPAFKLLHLATLLLILLGAWKTSVAILGTMDGLTLALSSL